MPVRSITGLACSIAVRRTHGGFVLAAALALALGGLVVSGPQPAAATPVYWVQLCEHPNYGGHCQTFTDDDTDLRSSYIGGDRASSVRIAPGTKAAIYEHNTFQGRCTTLTADIPDLKESHVGNDTVSSVRVGVGCANRPPDSGVQLCEHQNYRGRCLTFTGKVFNLRDYGFEDRVSSLRLAPDVTGLVALFEHPGYVGDCVDVKPGAAIPDLNVLGINDSISSVRIGIGTVVSPCQAHPPTKGVTFCRAPNYQGVCDTYHNDMPDLEGDSVGDNTISSVRLAPGLIVAVYDEKDFKGHCETIVADDRDLDDNAIRPNTISSFRMGQTC